MMSLEEKSSQSCENSTPESISSYACSDYAVPALDNLRDLTWTEKLAVLTYQFSKLPQVSCPVEHQFMPGLYLRTMRIPAGALFLGRAHTVGHKCELLEGTVLHITEHERRVIHAPYSLTSVPGYNMVLFTLTQVVGRTVHLNDDDSQDIESLERDIFAPAVEMIAAGEAISRRLT